MTHVPLCSCTRQGLKVIPCAGDTVGQKHTHPKVREGQQGDLTVNPSRHQCNWSTLTQGAKTLRKPAAGKTAHAAGPEEEHGTWEKTKWRSKEPPKPTPGADQQAGARHADAPGKGAEPRRGSCAGTRKKHKGVTGQQY